MKRTGQLAESPAGLVRGSLFQRRVAAVKVNWQMTQVLSVVSLGFCHLLSYQHEEADKWRWRFQVHPVRDFVQSHKLSVILVKSLVLDKISCKDGTRECAAPQFRCLVDA